VLCYTLPFVDQTIPAGSQYLPEIRALPPLAGLTAWGHYTSVIHDALVFNPVMRLHWYDASNFNFQTDLTGGPLNQPNPTFIAAAPAGATHAILQLTNNAVPYSTDGITGSLDFYCNSQPGGLQSPCCPPDPALERRLDVILSYVQLLQRQLAPFAYVAGAVHAGLTGQGTLSISGLIGAKVVTTVRPGSLGEAGTTPTEYFDVGFITFGTPDGYPHSYRLEHDPYIVFPSRCSAFTELAYDLHPGVTVTITELVRER